MKILNLPALAVFAAALVVGCAAREQPADRATEATRKSNEALSAHKGAKMTVKTIGVLGGLGPQATMDSLKPASTAWHSALIPLNKNGGYPPMVVYYYRHPPGLPDGRGQATIPLPARPPPARSCEAMGNLGRAFPGHHFQHSPHLFQAEIEQAASAGPSA